MARKPRACPIGVAQHIVQRGNNRQICFGDESDFAAYAHWLGESAERWGVALHAWVFMTLSTLPLAMPHRAWRTIGHCSLRTSMMGWSPGSDA